VTPGTGQDLAHATVILDGQGADEITGGYGYHQRAFIKERLLRRELLAAYQSPP